MDRRQSLRLAMDVSDKLYTAYKKDKLKVDLGGHYRNGEGIYDPKSFYEDIFDWFTLRKVPSDQLAALNDVLDGRRRALRKEVRIELTRTSHACYECGKGVTFRTNGRHYIADQCDFPGGIPAFEFELNVPSGTLVVGNDYRRAFGRLATTTSTTPSASTRPR